MPLTRKLIATLLCLAAVPCLAQNQHEMNQQAAAEANAADKKLNAIYKKVMATLNDEGQALLKASQRAWLSYRDAEANFVADEMRDGSAAPLLHAGTITTLTEERILRLKERLEADAPEEKPVSDTRTPTAREFTVFRDEWNAKAKTSDWKVVRKKLSSQEKGHAISLTLYYWCDGQLTSGFPLHTGTVAQISDSGGATETYNFVDKNLVGWLRAGDTDVMVAPSRDGFQDTGKQILREFSRYAQTIGTD